MLAKPFFRVILRWDMESGRVGPVWTKVDFGRISMDEQFLSPIEVAEILQVRKIPFMK